MRFDLSPITMTTTPIDIGQVCRISPGGNGWTLRQEKTGATHREASDHTTTSLDFRSLVFRHEPGLLTIENPYSSQTPLYLASCNGVVNASLRLDRLVDYSRSKIKESTLIRSIVTEEAYSFDTIWNNISVIPAGGKCTLKIGSEQIMDFTRLEIDSEIHDASITSLIESALDDVLSTENDLKVVHFSGGLDSTAILHCLTRKAPTRECTAVTWFVPGTGSHADLYHAKKLLRNLACVTWYSTLIQMRSFAPHPQSA